MEVNQIFNIIDILLSALLLASTGAALVDLFKTYKNKANRAIKTALIIFYSIIELSAIYTLIYYNIALKEVLSPNNLLLSNAIINTVIYVGLLVAEFLLFLISRDKI